MCSKSRLDESAPVSRAAVRTSWEDERIIRGVACGTKLERKQRGRCHRRHPSVYLPKRLAPRCKANEADN